MDALMKRLFGLLLIICILCGCGAQPVQTESPSEPVTEPVAEVTEVPTELPTEPPTEPPTEAPTEPVADRARDLIRSGDYDGALVLLEEEPDNEETAYLRLRAQLGDVETGEIITLGRYEQDAEEGNGPEPVEWAVLTTEDNKAFLLSLYCLDSRPYNNVIDGPVTWAESALREWLNGEFCDSVFAEEEQRLLLETELENADNPRYGTPGGENTADRVFLLSLDEVKAYVDADLGKGRTTAYARSHRADRNSSGDGWWWLRSPGTVRRDACYVDALGKISYYGYVVHRGGWSVRPAIWIDLNV